MKSSVAVRSNTFAVRALRPPRCGIRYNRIWQQRAWFGDKALLVPVLVTQVVINVRFAVAHRNGALHRRAKASGRVYRCLFPFVTFPILVAALPAGVVLAVARRVTAPMALGYQAHCAFALGIQQQHRMHHEAVPLGRLLASDPTQPPHADN